MDMNAVISLLQDDCNTLLNRALRGKTIGYFGIDGNGQHGRDTWAHYSTVSDVVAFIKSMSADDEVDCDAMIFLDGYDARVNGHILSDQNFLMSLNAHLKAADIDPSCLSWGTLEQQGDNCVVFKLDVHKLLEW